MKNPKNIAQGFPGSPVIRNLPASWGDMGSIPEDHTCRGATKPVHNYWPVLQSLGVTAADPCDAATEVHMP